MTPFEREMLRLRELQRQVRREAPPRRTARPYRCGYCGARTKFPRACHAHSDLPELEEGE